MKKIYFLLFIIVIVLISNLKLLSQCTYCEYLGIADPRSIGKFSYSSIEEATIVVKPAGLYYLYDVYLTYGTDNPFYKNDYDTFEIQHYFTLPENALIIDSWLWVEDQIMKAQILERNTAFNIYEGIVNRRRDPSILYKNGPRQYEFRIFPIPYGKTRKVKLSIMMPAYVEKGKTISTLPLQLLRKSVKLPNVTIIVYDKDTKEKSSLTSGNAFTSNVDVINGNFEKAIISPLDIFNNTEIMIGHNSNKSDEVSLVTEQDTSSADEGFYQLYLNPANLYKPAEKVKKAAIIIDHNSNFSLVDKIEILTSVKNFIKNELSDDEVRIYYNRLECKEATNGWTKVSDLALDDVFNTMQVGNNSILIPSLYKVYSDIKIENDAVVYLFSSDASLTSTSASQQLKNELYEEIGDLNKTYILNYVDIQKIQTQIFYNNYYYNGNELFYRILSSNTGGGAVHLNTYYQSISLAEGLNNIIQLKSESEYENFQYYLRLESGICYDNFVIKDANGYLQIGKYKGSGNFKIEYYFIRDSSLISENIILMNHSAEKAGTVGLSQVGLKIQAMERSSKESEKDLAVALSLKHRILSYNTAFLALEPSMQEPCFDCEAEDDVVIATDDVDINAVILSAYPNPFSVETIITLKNASDIDLISDVALYTLEGKKIDLKYQIEKMDSSLQIKIDGNELVKGIYLLKVNYNGKIYMLKIIKI